MLKKLLQRKRSCVLCLDHVEGDGRLLFQQIVKMDLEGIVCKRKDSPYKVTTTSIILGLAIVQPVQAATFTCAAGTHCGRLKDTAAIWRRTNELFGSLRSQCCHNSRRRDSRLDASDDCPMRRCSCAIAR